jgi:hypothetical protein
LWRLFCGEFRVLDIVDPKSAANWGFARDMPHSLRPAMENIAPKNQFLEVASHNNVQFFSTKGEWRHISEIQKPFPGNALPHTGNEPRSKHQNQSQANTGHSEAT